MPKVVGEVAAHDEVDGRSLLDEIAREGARRMLVAALETEVAAYLEAHGSSSRHQGRWRSSCGSAPMPSSPASS